MPEISIIIPIYNAEKYIERCISSILNQSFRNFELILVIDGSTDQSLSICNELSEQDNRISVIVQANGGAHSARKTGFKASTAPYITFVDADDTLPYNSLEILYSEIKKGYDIVKGSYTTIRAEGFIYSKYYLSEILGRDVYIKKIITNELSPFLWGGLYKKSLFNDESFDIAINNQIIVGEDWLTNIYIGKSINKCIQIEDIVYEYYVNSVSIMNTTVTSSSYMERIMKIVSGQIISEDIKLIIQQKIIFGYIYNFFIPELKFSTNRYKLILEYLKDDTNKTIAYNKLGKKHLTFINSYPIYFLYTRIYCYLFKYIRLKGEKRKVID